MGENGFKLKDGLQIGVASAATQIEGGELNHSWNDWYAKGHIKDGSNPARANGHYERWHEDADLMKEMGFPIYRLGIEWGRIEPSRGFFDKEVIKHYVDEIDLLLSYGIKPLVTLHHFTNPMWFERMGAFEKKENIKYFLDFIERMVTEFGERVSEYITINEPNVYATFGYFYGEWPPGKKSFLLAMKVMSILVGTHIKAYRLIHKTRKDLGFTDTKVGFANHMRVFDPEDPRNPIHILAAKATERFFQGSLSLAMYTGVFKWPIQNTFGISKGRYVDFLAMNYYTRSTVKGIADGVREGAPINDLGWEIYPQGIVRCAKKLHDILPLPIYVSENGTCDNDDRFRSLYLYDHIKALNASDLPFARYYHWCFCDNFEWIEGETPRFGVVKVDYDTQERTVKESGEFLSGISKTGGVDEELYNKHVRDKKYSY